MIYPCLQPTYNNRFILLEEYRYRGIKIPAGYETNGADIPRIFWIFIPPFKPSILPAVLMHDYLIESAKNQKDILIANEYFEEILLQIDNSLKSKVMIGAVKLYWKIKKINKEKK
jgi:hypothetical protein